MNGQTVFLWVGRLNHNKDPLTVLHGFHDFVKTTTSAHLYMIYQEFELLAQVENMIRQLSLGHCVHLVGHMPHEQLPEYYSASDFFVLGSHEEVCGYALIEAISCGSTPIVPDIPSFRKITGDGAIGFLWKAGTPASLSTALINAQLDRQERKAVRSFFERHLSYEQLGKQAMKIYTDAQARRSILPREN
jgi:glycosyltransferase involved in cell wall biosynthesis